MADPIVVDNKAKTMKRSSHQGDLRMKNLVWSLNNEHVQAMICDKDVRCTGSRAKTRRHTVNVMVRPIAAALWFSAGGDKPSFALGGGVQLSFWRESNILTLRSKTCYRGQRSPGAKPQREWGSTASPDILSLHLARAAVPNPRAQGRGTCGVCVCLFMSRCILCASISRPLPCPWFAAGTAEQGPSGNRSWLPIKLSTDVTSGCVHGRPSRLNRATIVSLCLVRGCLLSKRVFPSVEVRPNVGLWRWTPLVATLNLLSVGFNAFRVSRATRFGETNIRSAVRRRRPNLAPD